MTTMTKERKKDGKARRPGARGATKAGVKGLLVAMIIDASGSMCGLTEATISGFNEYLRDRKREDPDALMTLTLFNTRRDVRCVAAPVATVQELDRASYVADGGTALNDAVGGTIEAIDKAGDGGRKVLVVVTTDGMENSSTDFSRTRIAEMIKAKEAAGWKFVFFGANMDAIREGGSLNIAPTRSINYIADPAGTSANYRNLSAATRSYAAGADERVWSAELRPTKDASEDEPDTR